MLQSKPQPLTDRQDLIVETNASLGIEITAAIAKEAIRSGRGTAVLTIASDIESNKA